MGLVDDDHRFFERVEKAPAPGCWIWTGTRYYGYGYFYLLGRGSGAPAVRAHRWSYQRWVGPIPEDKEIDHLCRERACVNPAHLEAVTHKENIRRSPIHVGSRTHCPKGHPYDEKNTHRRKNGSRRCVTCHAIAERARQRGQRDGGGLSG